MRTLLPALDGLAPAYLVGGAVRDLLLGEASIDLDLALEGDGPATARALADRLGGEAVVHEQFGTATVRAGRLTLDLASTRTERYPAPGALPEVSPAGLGEDLRRRDFTINAMAIALPSGELRDPLGGRDDLGAKLVRVLHRASFADDPIRVLRAARYAARLGFALESETERLARMADLSTVSGARVRDALLDLLAEHEAPAAVDLLNGLGVLPGTGGDGERVAAAKLAATETGADPALSALAALVTGGDEGLVERLSLPAAARDSVARAAARGRELAAELASPMKRSQLHELLEREPPEALALALAFGAPGEMVLSFVAGLRDARLSIGGEDLLAAGVPESPAIGQALAKTLRAKLDGEVEGRDAELALALELARKSGG